MTCRSKLLLVPEGVWFAVTMGKAVNCLNSYLLIEAVRPLAMQICSAQVDLVDRGAFTVDTRQRIAGSGSPWLVKLPAICAADSSFCFPV